MSFVKDKNNIVRMASTVPTIKVQPHPEEILDLDEDTIAIGRAKLAGIEFDELYGQEDRVSPELMIRQQAQKIRELFQTPDDLKAAFSSSKKIEQATKDMAIDGIDLEFVREYCVRSQISFRDDVTTLLAVGFGQQSSGEANV
ncbi:MAG: hypothetical protein A2622_04365 [Bdellovibrionales bacterium RIFCSPHIGHO2_01_FULL_40_29]|nr:MAG: hypothetical protein A2622_04365 [Bdellovibrionales bacterium RIFCSPHIGHO2_01_FULL_40_29]OFZ34828.1 MAG: hypothetical protein A3D17_11010 [Bdellovibrionales bacterium RIFCSPHIGHO2_02_FULL_40_15]